MGYNNVRIKDRDQWKAAFKTNKGLVEPTVMFFGLCNSPATYQSMMDNLFIFETSEGWVIIYMDNIFIFTKEIDDNIEKTQRILQWLTDNDLYLKPEKCVFWQTKVEYLGLIIEENKLQWTQSNYLEWVVACTFVNNLSAFVDRPLCTVPMILLQCYCNWL